MLPFGNHCQRGGKEPLVDPAIDSSLQVMRILQQMPADLWIKSVEVTQRTVQGRVDRKKGVQVKGHGKEVSGRSIQTILTTWAGELEKAYNPEITSAVAAGGDTIDFGLFFDFVRPAAQEDD